MTQARYIGYTGKYLEINAPEAQTVSATGTRFTKVVNFGVPNPGSETETGGINVTGTLTSTRDPVNGTHVANKAYNDLRYLQISERTNNLTSSPGVDSILRFQGATSEVLPLTDNGAAIIAYATPEALSTGQKLPLIDKSNIFTSLNSFLNVKISNIDADGENGKIGLNEITATNGLTIVGIKPNSSLARRVTVEGDFVVNGMLNLKNGKKIWNEDNDGTGSGLDADTLDGNHWNAVLSIQSSLETSITVNRQAVEAEFQAADIIIQDQIDNRIRKDQNDSTPFNLGTRFLTISHNELNSGDGVLGPQILFNSVGTDNYSIAQRLVSNKLEFVRTVDDGNFTAQPNGRMPCVMDLLTGNVTFSGDITAFSDKRLKKNIKPIFGALALVQQIDPVWFDWADNDKADLGVIAQDVEKVFPNFVDTDSDGYKKVAYMKFIPLLLAAVKELANDR